MIITDSIGNPRVFPEKMKVDLEDTYPYILKKNYPQSSFWQLSFGNLLTFELLNQASGYAKNWDPNYIIIQSGLNDCRPEAFTDFEKVLLDKFSFKLIRRFKSLMYNAKLIKKRKISRINSSQFRKTISNFMKVFSKSNIIWLEISAHDNYEILRPGFKKKSDEFNNVLMSFPKINFLNIKKDLITNNGYNNDSIHLNKSGHSIVFKLLKEKILLNDK